MFNTQAIVQRGSALLPGIQLVVDRAVLVVAALAVLYIRYDENRPVPVLNGRLTPLLIPPQFPPSSS